PDARPAISTAVGRKHGADMDQQSFVAQVAAAGDGQAASHMFVVAGDAHPEHMALHADRPQAPVASNQGVLHFCPLAKYAIAFPRMSRSIFTRASSARKRLISICSAVTDLPPAPFNSPCRCALTQLY